MEKVNKKTIRKILGVACRKYLTNEISERELSKLVDDIKYGKALNGDVEVTDINLIKLIDFCSEIEFLHRSNPKLSQAEKHIKEFVFPKK